MPIKSKPIKEAVYAPSEDELADQLKMTLKMLREQNNYTQAMLAKYVGKARSSVSAWERTGDSVSPTFKPALHDLYLLNPLYKVSIDELLRIPHYINDPRIVLKIHKREFAFYNKRQIFYIDDDKKEHVAIVNNDLGCLLLDDGTRWNFSDIPKDKEFKTIPYDVYRKESWYPQSLTVEDLKAHIGDEDEDFEVWVSVKLNGSLFEKSPIDGYYKIIETGVEKDGLKLDFDTYSTKWLAFPADPNINKEHV
jgi:transcriptional regulator with XRE-family HTH domain